MGRRSRQLTIEEEVEAILAPGRVHWFGVKHFSPACAFHVRRLIRDVHPVGVLVEGPDDATELIQYIVHPDTRPPLTILSSYIDRKNIFGQNGVLSASANLPARFRGWWPMTRFCPEYAALKAGQEVGASLAFIDCPLTGTIPFRQVRTGEKSSVINDHHLAENAYFRELGHRQKRRNFDEFWNANFEVGATKIDTRRFQRAVLTFAMCARKMGDVEALEADGTLMRERHMRFCLNRFLKENPEGDVVVVTGAFHTVALPNTKPKKAKAKRDRNAETLLTPHSHRALDRLYPMGRIPNYADAVWAQLEHDSASPFDTAALGLLIEVMREARRRGEGLSTADAVGAYRVARNLAVLRRNAEITVNDLQDAIHMAYVKGDRTLRSIDVTAATRSVLVGGGVGQVTAEAGQVALMRDYYAQCKAHRLDTTGEQKTVRLDLQKQEKHRLKSAFLHRSSFLEIPMFVHLDSKNSWRARQTHYRGPDLATGENMHLITETWGVRWTEEVDATLLDLADLGAGVGAVCTTRLVHQLEACRGNAADTTRLMLQATQMALTDLFDEILDSVEDAIAVDSSFDHLAQALSDFVVLHSYRDAAATTGHERLGTTILGLYNRTTMLIPALAYTDDDRAKSTLDQLQSVVRIALGFEAIHLDREILVERVEELVADADGRALLRGAGYGILFSFGAVREQQVAAELEGYLRGAPHRVGQGGAFLEGLFCTCKSIFMGSPRLLRAVNAVLGDLDWDTFKLILPDLRRAFTQFIPAEIDGISTRVSEEIGLLATPTGDLPVEEALARAGAAADARVRATLDGWYPTFV